MAFQPQFPEDMFRRYIERRRVDLVKLEEALSKGDNAVIDNIGHQIKGNAATFGHDDLGEIAAELEAAGRAGDLVRAAHAIDNVRDWLRAQDS